ncbi:tripartite tricarboxylate transporter TctB family protein [Oscillospiraceae bacterium PP1C4]
MNNLKAKGLTHWVKRQNAGLWFGIGFLLYSIMFFVMSFGLEYQTKYGPGPGMYPRWLSAISIVVAAVYVWQSCAKNIFRAGECFPCAKELLNVAAIFVSCLVFMFLLDIVGFNIAGSLLLFVVFVRQFKLWQAVALSVVITYICFFIFKICFTIPLPVNALGF